MSWWIEENISYTHITDTQTPYDERLANICADDFASLPAYNSQQSSTTDPFILVRGSKAFVLATSKKYRLNSQNQWVEIHESSGGGGASSADQVSYDNTESGLTADNVQDAIDETLLKDFPRFFVCTCSTAANVAQKEIVCDDTSFELKKGVVIAVKFSHSNTASNVSFSVNGTTPTRIYYHTSVVTGSSADILGYANLYGFYTYDGVYWVWTSRSYIQPSPTNMSQTEATAGTATGGRLISAKVLHDTIENRLVQPETAISDLYSITTKQEQEITYSIDTGAKNRLLNTQTPGTYTIRNVDFTVLADGTIEVSPGTVTGGNADLSINASVDGLEVGETYVLTGCPDGGSTSGYRINISGVGADTGGGLEFLYEGRAVNVYIRISNNYVIGSTLTFKPMIRRVEIQGTSFEPYAPTNRELYEMILALQSGRSIQSVNSPMTLNLSRNDLNEKLDSSFDLIYSIPEEEEGESDV